MIGLTLVSLALDRHRCNIQQYETKRLILNICLHFSFKDALVAINDLHAAYECVFMSLSIKGRDTPDAVRNFSEMCI
jgi:hypothetical protein